MYAQVSAIAAPRPPTKTDMPEINRRSANFHPSIWGDRFLTYASEDLETEDNLKLQVQEMKEEVRRMLTSPVEEPSQKLNLINLLQRLGVSYHYENEIEKTLQQLHRTLYDRDDQENYIMQANAKIYFALQFRLLRQQGYYISCDKFSKFKDTNGNFKESLTSDVRGMLSLYEATHLRVHGEDILDEALLFTAPQLESVASRLSPPLAAEKQHQKELADIARWWKDLNFSRKLPFIRDRVIECYFWILGVYFEPEYCFARRILTKVIAMTSTIDDIYDVYGTLEEVELFTEAVERWDISAIDQLPEYMKVCYRALLDVYYEMEEKIGEAKSYRVKYAIEAMKNQVRAYFYEAKWFHQKHIPTMDEYMRIALVTSAYSMLATTSLVGMGDIVTKDSFEWLFSDPKIVRASAVVCRLMDDIVSHKFEQKRGHVASAVECYMAERWWYRRRSNQ
ncbi:hypothetical protein CMV_019820 [Castanea mollissima]|uniref:Uncharacterized protein n=1 Tax=Castanea mollissima TaxID=60419 RepID=A0A8J4QMH4_9ROSI|nr:hypothetical protein CMV_019820 [Castanea mollissima]